ncbi:hypothetical protein Syun_029124 [Stephania yunnanensis]|uniref:Phytocyanin domain-containing protein n=1 Tax=Stephania yunnanensis TaxID=152371 RepID=A0AAP0HL33_9MAGN
MISNKISASTSSQPATPGKDKAKFPLIGNVDQLSESAYSDSTQNDPLASSSSLPPSDFESSSDHLSIHRAHAIRFFKPLLPGLVQPSGPCLLSFQAHASRQLLLALCYLIFKDCDLTFTLHKAMLLLFVFTLFHVSAGAVHRVQWSVGDVDYNEWASSQSFHPGDTLVFEYHAQSHNVMQVNPSDFKSCNSTAPPFAIYTSGNDVVTFKMVGNYYFICGAPGHCEAGQKVEIKVVPSSSSSMSGASRPALSPSALSPVPPHTSNVAVNYATSRPLVIGLVGIALLLLIYDASKSPLLLGLLGIASSIALALCFQILHVIFALFHVSAGAVHKVQWSVGDVDYNEWASSQSFHPGDTLVFEYHAHSHNVMQVNPSDFKSCNSTAPPLAVYTSGNDAVTFKMAGNYYFICGAPGHCEAGRKVEIKVVPSSLSSSMSGDSRPALSPSALSPVPPHTSSVAVNYDASRPLLFGLLGIASSIVFKL